MDRRIMLLTGLPSVFVRSPDCTTWRPLLSTNRPLATDLLRLIAGKRPRLIPRGLSLQTETSFWLTLQRAAELLNQDRQLRRVHFFAGLFCDRLPISISKVRGHSELLSHDSAKLTWIQNRV